MVEIARDRSTPRILQLTIFLRNRLGALREALEKAGLALVGRDEIG